MSIKPSIYSSCLKAIPPPLPFQADQSTSNEGLSSYINSMRFAPDSLRVLRLAELTLAYTCAQPVSHHTVGTGFGCLSPSVCLFKWVHDKARVAWRSHTHATLSPPDLRFVSAHGHAWATHRFSCLRLWD